MADFSSIDALRDRAHHSCEYAHVPFSDEPVAAAALLRDGRWVPGVRVESAAFSLTIPAALNAITTLVTTGQLDALVALALSRPLTAADRQYLQGLPAPPVQFIEDDAATWLSSDSPDALPELAHPASPFLDATANEPTAGIQLARAVSEHAHIPASSFPVGAVLELVDGRCIPGVNVEHEDWTRTLCAERNAFGTACSYGETNVEALYLSCPLDPQGTPCGACRQLLSELAPDIRLWMDRDSEAPEVRSPRDLLPGSFRGKVLLRTSS